MENTNNMVETKPNLDMEVNFEAELEKYLNSDFDEVQEGSIISGEVVKITPNYVLVDVSFKSEGQIPVEEFQDSDGNLTVQEGDKVDVYVVSKDEVEGAITLSYERARRFKLLDELEQLMEENGTIRARITKRIKGGYHVDLGGIIAFLLALMSI